MQSKLAHLQLNVQPDNVAFYKELFTFMGWQVIAESEGFLGLVDTNGTSLWCIGHVKDVSNDYDGPGVNHLGIGVDAQADVDAVSKYLTERGVPLLFETPRHRPDFSGEGEQTYYQVMFETPDRILLEIVYTGPKSA
jgi:catechol 2,3-dioxygenase-like lactoylglutathione lyase family enzyme